MQSTDFWRVIWTHKYICLSFLNLISLTMHCHSHSSDEIDKMESSLVSFLVLLTFCWLIFFWSSIIHIMYIRSILVFSNMYTNSRLCILMCNCHNSQLSSFYLIATSSSIGWKLPALHRKFAVYPWPGRRSATVAPRWPRSSVRTRSTDPPNVVAHVRTLQEWRPQWHPREPINVRRPPGKVEPTGYTSPTIEHQTQMINSDLSKNI